VLTCGTRDSSGEEGACVLDAGRERSQAVYSKSNLGCSFGTLPISFAAGTRPLRSCDSRV